MGNFGRDSRGGGRSFGGNRGGFGGGRGGFGGGRGGFGGSDGGRREMFSAICSDCGKECQVPFKPTNGKPVYCSECFEKMGGRNDSRQSSDRPRFDDRSRAPQAQNAPDLSSIHAKLDKILSILEPKVVKAPEAKAEPETVKVAEVVDLPKIKKAVKKAVKKTSKKTK